MSNNNTAAIDRQKRHMGLKASARISNTIIYVILVIMSIIWLEPAPRLNTSMRRRSGPLLMATA